MSMEREGRHSRWMRPRGLVPRAGVRMGCLLGREAEHPRRIPYTER